MSRLNDFKTERASPYIQLGMACISSREYNWKLKFSMQTQLTHENTTLECWCGSVNLDNVNGLYLENGNVYRPVLKVKPQNMISYRLLC